VDAIPRRAAIADLEPIVGDLAAIREEVDILLNSHMNVEDSIGNDDRNERQYSDSNTDSLIEFEPALEKSGVTAEPRPTPQEPPKGYPLGFVLKACPEIVDYAVDGIGGWRDLMAVAAQVRGYLGVSPPAYEDACHVMGPENAAIVVACILQRAQHINSAGGYLRALTEKARAGEFTVGPMLMAAFKANGSTARMAG
jgi:replication initiation protein RepC